MRISIESSELIKEAKADIEEFGGEKEVAVWYISSLLSKKEIIDAVKKERWS